MNILIILGIALATIVFIDQRLNGRSGIGWAVFVGATSIFGFILYMIFSMDTLQLSARRLKDRIFEEQISSEVYHPKEKIIDRSEKSLPPVGITVPGFVDEKLEVYLKYGDYRQAREYIQNIFQLAGEKEDEETPMKYEDYIDRINELDWSDKDWLVNNQETTR